MKAQNHIETLNEYIGKFPNELPFGSVTLEELEGDNDKLNKCIDFVIGLFARIGLSENMAPTFDGIRLDACLEFLGDIKK